LVSEIAVLTIQGLIFYIPVLFTYTLWQFNVSLLQL